VNDSMAPQVEVETFPDPQKWRSVRKGQNGELNAVETDSTRASPPPSSAWFP